MPETGNETPQTWWADLEALKQKAIEETIEEITKWKNVLFSDIKKKLLNRYLTKDWDWREWIEDNFLESIWWDLITDNIKHFKEELSKVSDETALNNLKASVIESINAAATTTAVATTTTTSGQRGRRSSRRESTTRTSVDNQRYSIDQFNINVSQEHRDIYNQLRWKEKPDLEPFACAMKWYEELRWSLKNPTYLTVVDFTKPNNQNRFYVINMTTKSVEYATTVWHWQWSWTWQFATSFSDVSWSYQSSLGFFRTPDALLKPTNRNRSWLLMNGIEDSNDSARSRWIYMHPGGKISQWCFTLPKDTSSEIMNKVKWDSLLFAYAKSKDYFAQSQYFSTSSAWDVLAA